MILTIDIGLEIEPRNIHNLDEYKIYGEPELLHSLIYLVNNSLQNILKKKTDEIGVEYDHKQTPFRK